MANSRLSQIGIGVTAYTTPVDVDLSTADWGWTAYPLTVDYKLASISRLGQHAVSTAQYPPPSSSINIGLARQNWGWTSYPITVPGDSFYLTQADWGWTAQNPIICSQYEKGYYGSFNGNVWPTCAFNDHVFGPRTSDVLYLKPQSWGWQSFNINVHYEDPIDVYLQRADWGWTNIPLSVSYGTDVHLNVASWGWQSFPISAELPYDLALQSANWGWTSIPIGVTYAYNVGLTIASYGWQPFPLTIEVPSFNVKLRRANWGWQSFPVTVRQASLLPDDIALIAEAVYQKFMDEGAIDQLLETWMRLGCAHGYPQTFHTREDGHSIECGHMTIQQTTDSKGNVTQTRQ